MCSLPNDLPFFTCIAALFRKRACADDFVRFQQDPFRVRSRITSFHNFSFLRYTKTVVMDSLPFYFLLFAGILLLDVKSAGADDAWRQGEGEG